MFRIQRFFEISILLLIKYVVCHSNEHCSCPNETPIQSYLWGDENVKKLIDEINLLKISLEILQIQFESKLSNTEDKLDLLINKRHEDDSSNNGAGIESQSTRISRQHPSNCVAALARTRKDGIHSIQLNDYDQKPFLVYCDDLTHGGGWTVIQRRQDGSIDFLRKWDEYKNGFGNLEGEFFIGLDKLHAITTEEPQELLIVMEDFDNVTKYAMYETFAIGNEKELYALNVLGKYSGDAGDSLSGQASQKFTTIDKDNDEHNTNCAMVYKGAWWHKACHSSNLNGSYLKGEYAKEKYAQGVVWKSWKGYYYSLKSVKMLLRPKRT